MSARIRHVEFRLDERSLEPLDRLIAQGRCFEGMTPDNVEYIPVTHPETGETRVIVIPK